MLRYVTPLVLSTSLYAGHGGAPELGGYFKGELRYSENKILEDTLTRKSGSQQSFDQQAYANFTIHGKLRSDVMYEADFQAIATRNHEAVSGTAAATGGASGMGNHCMGTPLRTAKATWMHGDMFSVAVGCSKHFSGGHDFANFNEAKTIRAYNRANGNSPSLVNQHSFSYVPNFRAFNPSIELGFHMFGDFKLQILDDVHTGNGAMWETKRQQTWNLQWSGNFMGIKPIAQYGVYDAGHSNHWNIGLMADVAGFGITLDYMAVANSRKVSKTTTEAESKMDNSSRFSVELAYDVMGMWMPKLYYSMYDFKRESADAKSNIASTPATWNDNGQVLGLSVAWTAMDGFTPYLALDNHSGKFFQSDGTTEKNRSDLVVRLGATTHF